MRTLKAIFSRLHRKYLGRYAIDDPREIAERSPYTFHLPSENELLALQPGDIAKLTIRSIPPSPLYGAERMWVTIRAVNGDSLTGGLDNIPFDMPQLPLGAVIAFRRSDIIDIRWCAPRSVVAPKAPPRREYWDRCFVDRCVTEDRVPIHYLYREEPEHDDEDKFPDSGWRIRGDYRDLDDEALDARTLEYVALARVLNADDSWLHLIDAPVGSAFLRNWETGGFEPAD
jgi:hypothetical protein